MNTDQLIDTLTQDVPVVRRGAVSRRLAFGMIGGGIVTTILLVGSLGLRPDLAVAVRGFSFWMKWTYTMSLGGLAVVMTARLARPNSVSLRWLWLIAIPILLLAGLSIGEMVHVPSVDWLAMWLGTSWKVCPWLVLTFAMPIFIGLLWSFRQLAPTRLRAAGAAAGLAAGAWSATIYCLHCPEVSAIFVLTWYTLGIALAALLGALVGPKFLRW